MITRRARIWWVDCKDGREGVWEEPKDRIGSVYLDADGNEVWSMWDEGNYSCDCNREILFLGTAQDEVSCGDGRFEILKRETIK